MTAFLHQALAYATKGLAYGRPGTVGKGPNTKIDESHDLKKARQVGTIELYPGY